MITVEEVVQHVRKALRSRDSESLVLDADTDLTEIGLSSLQVSEIVFGLEDDHDIEFDAAEAAEITTIGQLVALGNSAVQAGA